MGPIFDVLDEKDSDQTFLEDSFIMFNAIVATKTGVGKQKIETQEYGRDKDSGTRGKLHGSDSTLSVLFQFDGNLSHHPSCVSPSYVGNIRSDA